MADLSTLDVLIVDDHEGMRALLRKVLERAGVAAIREAGAGADGLELLAQSPAHLILVDQNMPGMNGAEFVARLRESGSSARIVMITGDVRANAAGADVALLKPVSPRELLAAIEAVMR